MDGGSAGHENIFCEYISRAVNHFAFDYCILWRDFPLAISGVTLIHWGKAFSPRHKTCNSPSAGALGWVVSILLSKNFTKKHTSL